MTRTANIENIKVDISNTVEEVVAVIQKSGSFACALMYKETKFENIITDGDVRRAILAGFKITDSASCLLEVKQKSLRTKAIVMDIDSSPEAISQVFDQYSLRQLVLVNKQGDPVQLIDHASIGSKLSNLDQKFIAVVMAGGFGTRMRPLTLDTPKPMLPINGRPLLDILIERLVSYGASQIYITTHYLPEKIRSHFGDGSSVGIPIKYIHEETPLGTGGALARIDSPDANVLVVNGDILTELDFGMFHAEHIRNKAAMTIGAKQYTFQVPFGVLDEKNGRVTAIEEKPNFGFLVNSGMYFVSKEAFNYLPADKEVFTMPEFAEKLISNNQYVNCFPIYESWLDVGRPDDYATASKIYIG